MKKLKKRQSILKYLFIIVCFLTMTLNFKSNIFKTANPDWFKNFQSDSESLVIGKIIDSRHNGIKHAGGFLGFSDGNFYITSEKTQNIYNIYTAQSGVQGILFSLLDRELNNEPQEKLEFFYLLNSSLLGFFISLMILFFINEIGIFAGISIFLGVIYSPWLTVAGKNLYWVLWTQFLPIVTFFYYMKYRKLEKNKRYEFLKMFGIVFVTLYFKFLNGFEYTPQVLIGMELPIIYFSIKNRRKLKEFVKDFVWTGSSSLLAFFVAMITTFYQISYAKNISLKDSMKDLFLRVAYRTGFRAENYRIDDVFNESLQSSRLKIIKTYFFESPIISKYVVFELFLFLCIFTFILYYYINNFKRDMIALNVITLVSLFGPISWIILAKGHSYIHTHINFMLFNMPFSLLLCAFIGGVIQKIIDKTFT